MATKEERRGHRRKPANRSLIMEVRDGAAREDQNGGERKERREKVWEASYVLVEDALSNPHSNVVQTCALRIKRLVRAGKGR